MPSDVRALTIISSCWNTSPETYKLIVTDPCNCRGALSTPTSLRLTGFTAGAEDGLMQSHTSLEISHTAAPVSTRNDMSLPNTIV